MNRRQVLVIKQENESDWWENLALEERLNKGIGLKEADIGQLQKYEFVMPKYRKWL